MERTGLPGPVMLPTAERGEVENPVEACSAEQPVEACSAASDAPVNWFWEVVPQLPALAYTGLYARQQGSATAKE